MEEQWKNHESAAAEDATRKRQRATASSEDAGGDILTWLSSDDDAVRELTLLLDDTENGRLVAEKVKFIENPYSSAMIFQSSSSYVTINGNEESCGSSFSDSDSSVMASVDLRGINIKLLEVDSETLVKWKSLSDDQLKTDDGGWIGGEETSVSDGGIDGTDELSWDDEDLARFIGEGEQRL